MWRTRLVLFYLASVIIVLGDSKKSQVTPEWAKKDITDFSDADMDRLLDQWEEDEDPLEPDELPEHLRPQPPIDFTKFQTGNPEDMLKLTKKGRTLMAFVAVGGNPSRGETETVTKLWQSSLWNSHIQAERYLIEDNRAIFLFKDGSQAWDAKDFLVQQERCKEVSIENKIYPGKNYPQESEDEKLKKEEL